MSKNALKAKINQNNPIKIATDVSKCIIGQNDYINALTSILWMQKEKYRLNKSPVTKTEVSFSPPNTLVLGNSGTGKTSSIKRIAKEFGLNIIVVDASTLTGSGVRGMDVDDIAENIMDAAKWNTDVAEYSVVILDELDKVLYKNAFTKYPHMDPTPNLLKFIEGRRFNLMKKILFDENGCPIENVDSPFPIMPSHFSLDTSNILFIGLGAFEGLEDIILKSTKKNNSIGFNKEPVTNEYVENPLSKVTMKNLIEYGVNPQLLGRFSYITATNNLTESSLKEILMNSPISPVKEYARLTKNILDLNIDISDTAAEAIAKKGANSAMGARYLNQFISDLLVEKINQASFSPDTVLLYIDIVDGKFKVIDSPLELE